jgi:CheY-like chemotaxis protein
VDANAVITDAVALLRKLVSEQVELRIILAPEPPIALADKTQMEQVLMNLALNARDAMPDGGQLVIESHVVDIDEEYVRLHKHAQTGRYVLLTVTDTGIGMDDDTRNRIFEPFFTTKETGHGLGLATVYGIVKQHQGFIHVYSEPGVGTTFRTYLPTAAESVEVVVPHPVEARLRGTECILLAEDHEGMREMVREILEELGYTLLVAANGEEAVRVFEAHSNAVDLVILDVIMPKLNGPDAYERMRALRSDLPVVFASGYSTEVDREIVRNQGHPYLQKPYDPGVLKRKVREVLNLAK